MPTKEILEGKCFSSSMWDLCGGNLHYFSPTDQIGWDGGVLTQTYLRVPRFAKGLRATRAIPHDPPRLIQC